MCHAVVTVVRVQPSHGDEVVKDVVREAAPTKLLVTPVIERHVDIGYGSPHSGRVFGRHAGHVLRPRPGQFIDLADVGQRTLQHGRDHLRHITNRNWRRPPGTKRQAYGAILLDRGCGPCREKEMLKEDCWPDMHDWQTGPIENL